MNVPVGTNNPVAARIVEGLSPHMPDGYHVSLYTAVDAAGLDACFHLLPTVSSSGGAFRFAYLAWVVIAFDGMPPDARLLYGMQFSGEALLGLADDEVEHTIETVAAGLVTYFNTGQPAPKHMENGGLLPAPGHMVLTGFHKGDSAGA